MHPVARSDYSKAMADLNVIDPFRETDPTQEFGPVGRQSAASLRGRRWRIGYVTEGSSFGGTEQSTALLIRSLDPTRFTPILFCPAEPALDSWVSGLRESGVECIPTPLLAENRRDSFIAHAFALARVLRPMRLDILHIQMRGGFGARSIALAGRLAGIRHIVTTIRGAHFSALSPSARFVSRAMDRLTTVFTVASQENKALQMRNVGRRDSHVIVIYNAIDPERFRQGAVSSDQSAIRASLGLKPNGPVVGSIGRMDAYEQKGFGHFIDAASQVREAVPDAQFVIVGDGEKEEKYRAQVTRLGLDDCFRFPGFRSDIPECLSAMDVFVLASTWEPFGLVLAEAMAMEKPVVAARSGGMPEVVQDGVTGAIVPPCDPPAIASAVTRYLNDPVLAARHGAAGRLRVLERFSPGRLICEMSFLYERLLGGVEESR